MFGVRCSTFVFRPPEPGIRTIQELLGHNDVSTTMIYTGLTILSDETGFFVACDMPFLSESLIRHMVDVTGDFDAVVPRMDWMLEPLHALYSKKCLPIIQEAIGQNEHQILKCFAKLRVRYVDEEELRLWNPDLRSFFNINKPQDLPGAAS